MAIASRYPALLPSREQIDAERALMQQSAKLGRELEQGLFIAQVLADERCGMHLIHAMLKPKREALERIAEFRQTGVIDLGEAKAERKGKVGYVTLLNTKFLNAEDDRATAALETVVDLVLLDDTIEVGVLRGGPFPSEIQGPPHLQCGNQSHAPLLRPNLVRAFLHRARAWFAAQDLPRTLALGILRRAIRGLCREAVDRGGRSLRHRRRLSALCIMDRVLAEEGAYFNLPASKEGFIPGPRTCASRG